jgi:hypothetical protein
LISVMRRTKHVIAVMVVATALCADRAATAAPLARPEATPSQARKIASRITRSFRQTVARVAMFRARTGEQAISFALCIREAASGVRFEFSPVQFRLPPPAL